MSTRYLHPSYAGRMSQRESEHAEADLPRVIAPGIDLRILIQADRSCCCTAMPAVIAIMPPAAGRAGQVDLLLCMHHYRAARHGLASAGATVVDSSGAVLTRGCAQIFAAAGGR